MNKTRASLPLWLLMLLLLLLLPAAARANERRVSNCQQLVEALRSVKAGDTILIAAGTYPGGFSQANLRGAEGAPIVIAGADPNHPPILEGGNGVHLSSPEHVQLRDLVLAGSGGNGLNIDDAGSTSTPAHHVVLKNVVVRDVGPSGNRDGVKLSGVRDFRIEGCTIERWGSGGSAIDMVGCHNGLIRECQILNARGDGANGVQAKGGSSQIVIERCRFQDAGGRGVNTGGSTGLEFFRPPMATFEAADITVQDCEFLGGMAAIAFVGVDGALVEHNTIYRSRRWPLRILQENTDSRFVPSRNGRFINNIVVFRSDEVRQVVNIGPNTEPESFRFSGNQWYCLDRPADTLRSLGLPVKEENGIYGVDPELSRAEQGDLRKRSRKPGDAGARREGSQ
jgi:hypothetical protein